ncbi:MAG: GNAT family N-acetyltransferase [Ruminococcaceae bacterium]|nr:GNAT family N-acetyltransferase [Oscillospiraceae bacterium]
MVLQPIPYIAGEHAALIQTWLDDDGICGTGIEDWDEDVRYWREESPDTFQVLLFGTPEPTAAVYYFTEPDNLHIGALLVNPEKRGRGIGSAILKYLLYTHTNYSKATAVIYPDNTASEQAFRNAGFVYVRSHEDMTATYWEWHKPSVTIAEEGELEPKMYGAGKPYRFVVVFARYQNKWLYVRHKRRRSWETAGGHIEPGETPLKAAKRELWEETGAVEYTIRYAFDYHVDNNAAVRRDHAAGQVFIAEITSLGPIPAFEMAESSLWDTYPPTEELTYPAILPELYGRIITL